MSHPGLIHKDFIVVTIKNFGQTPAKDTTVFAYFTDTKFPERLPDDFFEHNDVDVVSAAHVRPTLARFLLQRGQAEISKSVIQDIRPLRLAKPRERYIYVFGRIYYRDIYDKNWRTKFCYVWEPWHPSGPRFVPYEAYNDEDQNELLYE
jgi:hypothetical protein